MRDNNDDNFQPPGGDSSGTPKFGRLLLILAVAVLIIVAVTFGSAAYYS